MDARECNALRYTRPMKHRAFTLVELLIVVAILAVLTGVMYPMFARARENARRASCQSNLKQIGLGVMQYVRDYDEMMPLVRSTGAGTAIGPAPTFGWADALQPYLKSISIYHCPSDVYPTQAAPKARGFTDYYFNANLNG